MPVNSRKLVCAVVALFGCAVHAEGLNFGVDAGVGESDNITLAEVNKVSQTIGVADLDFSFGNKTSRHDEDVSGAFTYLDFFQHEYRRELYGNFGALAHYSLIPESVVWTAQDFWGQSVRDPFGALVPTNLQNVNYFNTGPDWYERLGGRSFLKVSARYARAQYQASPINNNRFLGSVELGRDVSASSSVSLNGSAQRILYNDSTLNPNYGLSSFYGRYEMHGARTTAMLNVGVDQISLSGQTNRGSLAELRVTHAVSAATSVTVTAGRGLTDTSADLNNLQANTNNNVGNVTGSVSGAPSVVSSSVYTSNNLSAQWRYERGRTILDLDFHLDRNRYVSQPQLDGSRDRYEFRAERKLNHALSAQFFADLYRTQYDHSGFSANAASATSSDKLAGLTLILRQGRGIEYRLRYDNLTRDVTGNSFTPYRENRVFLTIGYRPAPR